MSKLSAEEIFNIVDELIGECDAVGESHIDVVRLANLEKLLEVTNRCLDKIAYASNTDTRSEYSMRQIGRTALKWMADSAKWFELQRVRYKNIGE